MIVLRKGAAAILPVLDIPTPCFLSSADRLALVELLRVAQVQLLEVAKAAAASGAEWASPLLVLRLESWASQSADLQERLSDGEAVDPIIGRNGRG